MAGVHGAARHELGESEQRPPLAAHHQPLQDRPVQMTVAAARRPGILMLLRAFARERRGVAALEFAVFLPLFLILYLGTFEVGQGVAIKLNNGLAARTVADLASQYTDIYNADMSNILGASTTVMAPYPTQPFSVTVSEVTVDAKGNATITWSDSLNGTARAVGQPVTLDRKSTRL